jgi:gamma-glutamyltranspeptidase
LRLGVPASAAPTSTRFAVDRDGNMVTLTQTLLTLFGAHRPAGHGHPHEQR